MKIATYNVNGIRARLPRLLDWLEREQPDVACLQEPSGIPDRDCVRVVRVLGLAHEREPLPRRERVVLERVEPV